MKNIGVRSFIVGLCLMGLGSWSPSLKAQIADRVYKTDYHIDPEKARELSVELDNKPLCLVPKAPATNTLW